ncbi:MAG: cyclic nucleotide-binding domain-containing protein [Kiloniellales bacterium]
MNTEDWRAFLSAHPVFSCLSGDQRARLLSEEASEERTCSQDEVILQEGTEGDSIFLIATGEVSVVLPGAGGRPVPISTLGEGEFFGEMALIEKKPRLATVIAREETVLLEIKGPAFYKLLRENAEFEFKVLSVLSERLRHLVEHTLSVQLKDLDERLELLNRRLDADLKVVAAELKASQAVFDQTSTRANEIIVSAERSRTRLTAVISAVGGVVAVVVALGGFFGVSELVKINKLAEKTESAAEQAKSAAEKAKTAVKNIQASSDLLEGMKVQIQEAKSQLEDFDGDVNRFRDLRLGFYKQTIIPRFSEEVTKGLGTASKTYKEVLKEGLTDELFKSISGGITTIADDLELTRAIREEYKNILKEGIQERYVDTDQQEILSYYLLLVALAFDDEGSEYNAVLKDFEDYIESDYKDPPIKHLLEEDFGPELYKTLIEEESPSIFGPKDSDGGAAETEQAVSRTPEAKTRMINRVLGAWAKIP